MMILMARRGFDQRRRQQSDIRVNAMLMTRRFDELHGEEANSRREGCVPSLL